MAIDGNMKLEQDLSAVKVEYMSKVHAEKMDARMKSVRLRPCARPWATIKTWIREKIFSDLTLILKKAIVWDGKMCHFLAPARNCGTAKQQTFRHGAQKLKRVCINLLVVLGWVFRLGLVFRSSAIVNQHPLLFSCWDLRRVVLN